MPLCHSAPLRTLAAALLTAASAAAAEEPSPDLAQLELEDLMALTVRTASKHEQSISSAPASVSIVTREEIRDHGYRTLADVLAGVRGLFVSYDRNYSYLGFRGFERPGDYNTRVLLLVDGHQVNDDIWDMAFIGPELALDLDLVERVEVVRGPSSSMYGGNALFGIVNLITRVPAALGRGEVAASAGSFGSYAARASVAHAAGDGPDALLSVSGSDVAGQDLRYAEYSGAPGAGWTRGKDWERWGSFLAKSSWRGLTLEAMGGWRDKGVPTGSFGTAFDDSRNKTSDRRLFTELRYELQPHGAVDASVRAYFDAYDFHQWYAFDAGDGSPITVNADADRGRWVGTEAKAVWRLGGGWLAVAGGEAKYHFRQELQNFDEGGQVYLFDRRSTTVASVYAQLEAPVTRWLTLTAGGRYDRVGTFAEALSPRAAIIWTPSATTAVKGIYGHAFRPPNDAEQHYEQPGYWKKPAGLTPEKIATYELVLEQRLGRGAQVSAVAYRYEVKDLISQAMDPQGGLNTYANVNSVRATGVELEAAQRWENGVAARASWALQRAEDGDSGGRLTNSPTHLGKLQLHGPLGWLGLRGGVELLYVSSRTTRAGAAAPAHALVNLNLVTARLAAGALDLALGVRNALGASYGDPGSGEHLQDVIAQDGRTVQVKATWRY